jgi:hypothetical protein
VAAEPEKRKRAIRAPRGCPFDGRGRRDRSGMIGAEGADDQLAREVGALEGCIRGTAPRAVTGELNGGPMVAAMRRRAAKSRPRMRAESGRAASVPPARCSGGRVAETLGRICRVANK